MCCKCFSNRKNPLWIIALFALLAIGTSVLMIYYAYMLIDEALIERLEEDTDIQEVVVFKDVLLSIMTVFGVGSIVMALLSCCFRCCYTKKFAVTYGIVLFPAWLITTGVGIGCFVGMLVGNNAIEVGCDTLADGYIIDYSDYNPLN